jgi:hypothetical protein
MGATPPHASEKVGAVVPDRPGLGPRCLGARRDTRPDRASRASVLVIVLVTVLFTAAALVAFVEKAGDDLIVEAREVTARRLRQEAYSALEVTLGVLEDFRLVNGGLRSPAEGWNDPLAFAGWAPRDGCTVEIAFEDESGKLSLPHVEAATLLNLFEAWGLAQADAERLSDTLLGWMRKDHVYSQRTPDYEQGPLPYTAPLRSLRSYSELAAIDYAREVFYDDNGRPNELWQRFVAAISLLDFKQTNLNGAGGDVVTAMGSLDRSQQQQLGDYLKGTGDRAREGPGFFGSAAEATNVIGAALPPGYGTEIAALRIHITVHEGRAAFRLTTVVAPSGGATTVQAVAPAAADGKLAQSTTTAANQPKAAADTPKKLNYPFTLLEIRENAEIAAVPAPPTKA